jgi:hypothetical protein
MEMDTGNKRLERGARATQKSEHRNAPGGIAEPEIQYSEGSVLTPTPLPKIDLRDGNAIRRELGGVYRDMRAGRITSQDGTRLAYVLDMIRKAYETAILQERIELLERSIQHRGS